MKDMKEKILFVDDEEKVLDAYRRALRKHFEVVTALGAEEALACFKSKGPFPLVVSDMQMPKVNGAQLLGFIKQKFPDTVRIMLTGNADQKTAIDAINTSDVFRFLNKPCSPEDMIKAINAGLEKYRALQVERELLDGTVKGCVSSLVDILSMAKPEIFGRAKRVRDYAAQCAHKMSLNIDVLWEVETVAMLSQAGLMSLPDSLLDRALRGLPISETDKMLFSGHYEVAAQLLSNIPKMEGVERSLRLLGESSTAANCETHPMSVQLVKPIIELTKAEANGLSSVEALSLIETTGEFYSERVTKALRSVIGELEETRVCEISVDQLKAGMEVASDINTLSGALLVERGQQLTDAMVKRLYNFSCSEEISPTVRIRVRSTDSDFAAA